MSSRRKFKSSTKSAFKYVNKVINTADDCSEDIFEESLKLCLSSSSPEQARVPFDLNANEKPKPTNGKRRSKTAAKRICQYFKPIRDDIDEQQHQYQQQQLHLNHDSSTNQDQESCYDDGTVSGDMMSAAALQMPLSNGDHNLYQHQEAYAKRLDELKSQLNCLKKGGSLTRRVEPAQQVDYVESYIAQTLRKEEEARENLVLLDAWLINQRSELEQLYVNERAKAVQELADQQRELKEKLLNEYQEKRKQLEVDKSVLDINIDITEVKPIPTRKLRRRQYDKTNSTTSVMF